MWQWLLLSQLRRLIIGWALCECSRGVLETIWVVLTHLCEDEKRGIGVIEVTKRAMGTVLWTFRAFSSLSFFLRSGFVVAIINFVVVVEKKDKNKKKTF